MDCVQLGKFLNANTAFHIGIMTVELPVSIDVQTVYLKAVDRYLIGLNRSKLNYPFCSSSDYPFQLYHRPRNGAYLTRTFVVTGFREGRCDAMRKEQDIEADEFAGQLLMPECLLLCCTFRWPSKMAEYFKVSHTAIWQRLNNLKRLDDLGDAEKEKRYTRCCDVCGNANILIGYTKYCSICGKEMSKNTWGVMPIHYSEPESARNRVVIRSAVRICTRQKKVNAQAADSRGGIRVLQSVLRSIRRLTGTAYRVEGSPYSFPKGFLPTGGMR